MISVTYLAVSAIIFFVGFVSVIAGLILIIINKIRGSSYAQLNNTIPLQSNADHQTYYDKKRRTAIRLLRDGMIGILISLIMPILLFVFHI